MPGPYGLTPDGIVLKTKAEIIAEIEARQRADLGADWNTRAEPVATQNELVADELAQLWEALGTIYNSIDRNQAEDAALDMIGEIVGTPRRPATKSRVTATVVLEPGANIPAGDAVASVDGSPLARFVNAEPMVHNGDDDSYEIIFEAETAAPVVANAGTLTVIETQLSGWASITNEEDAEVGLPIESNADYRQRQVEELQAQGGCTVEGIRADLARLEYPGIPGPIARSVSIIENTSDIVDVNGLPPHSFEALIDFTNKVDFELAIARYLWLNKPPSVATHGVIAVTIQDTQGEDQIVRFTRVRERKVYIAIDTSQVPTAFEMPDTPELSAAIVQATRTRDDPAYLGVGSDVHANAILCALIDAGAHPNISVGVSFSAIGLPSQGSQSLAIDVRERATIDAGDVAWGPS